MIWELFSRVKAGIPVPVKHLPDPTRIREAFTRPVPAGTGRVYPPVRVYPQTSIPNATKATAAAFVDESLDDIYTAKKDKLLIIVVKFCFPLLFSFTYEVQK